MIAWHGLVDKAIPPQGTTTYYQEVLKTDYNAHDFLRFFEAPGVGHCYGGVGPVPNEALNQLIDWVEKGAAPDTLEAVGGSNGTAWNLCPYPLQQVYVSGDPRKSGSFTCNTLNKIAISVPWCGHRQNPTQTQILYKGL